MINYATGWHWLETVALSAFWVLVIVLALAPIKYLQAQLNSPELGESIPDDDAGKRP